MLGDKDNFYDVCKPLITDIENKNKIAIVSNLVIMETIHVLRQRIIGRNQFAGTNAAIHERMAIQAKTLTQKFIKIKNLFTCTNIQKLFHPLRSQRIVRKEFNNLHAQPSAI